MVFWKTQEKKPSVVCYHYHIIITRLFCQIHKCNVVLSWQKGDTCTCSMGFAKHGKTDEKQCNMPCAGSTGTKCGGSLANSVFSTLCEFQYSYIHVVPLPSTWAGLAYLSLQEVFISCRLISHNLANGFGHNLKQENICELCAHFLKNIYIY